MVGNVTITGLPAGGVVSAADLYPSVQSLNTVKVTAAQMKTFMLGITPIVVGTGAAATTIAGSGAFNLILTTNSGVANQGIITIANGVNGNITIGPDGIGAVVLSTPTVVVGTGAAATTIAGSGAYDLTLTTNNGGLNQGTITIANGANGNITIDPDGTGIISLAGVTTGTGSIRSSSSSGGIGYSTGAGGTVTQATSKSTTVALNAATGTIVMNGASLAAATIVSFTFTNTSIAATDMVVINHSSVGTLGGYGFAVTPGAGTSTVFVRNNTAGALAEAIVLQFAIIKSVTS